MSFTVQNGWFKSTVEPTWEENVFFLFYLTLLWDILESPQWQIDTLQLTCHMLDYRRTTSRRSGWETESSNSHTLNLCAFNTAMSGVYLKWCIERFVMVLESLSAGIWMNEQIKNQFVGKFSKWMLPYNGLLQIRVDLLTRSCDLIKHGTHVELHDPWPISFQLLHPPCRICIISL